MAIDFTDVLPALADLMGARSRGVPSNKVGARRPKRDWIFAQYGEARVVRDRCFNLYSSGALYDLKADPFEEVDLSNSGNAEAPRAKMKLGRVPKSFPVDPAPPPSSAVGDDEQ